MEDKFNEKVEDWIAQGWLRPCVQPAHGVIPFLVVVQFNKDMVRPVMDFRELNKFVESFTGDSDVCGETMRKWRMMDGQPRVLDLRDAYLQLHVKEELQRYQTVEYKGRYYELTRLGFGLNCAPKIMTAVLGKVLSLDPRLTRLPTNT